MNSDNLQLARSIYLQEAVKRAKQVWIESLPQSKGRYGKISKNNLPSVENLAAKIELLVESISPNSSLLNRLRNMNEFNMFNENDINRMFKPLEDVIHILVDHLSFTSKEQTPFE
jgi:hypothetical protein